ncbi:MAG: efflux RND transporter permease subunit [Gammaproteobacteria bacterium]|nr:efflux RND transporter permease subunit [Gammaproteobacteria bacterium]
MTPLANQIREQSIDHGPMGFFARNAVAANLLMSVFLVGGLWMATNLNSAVFPTIKPGIVAVNVPYPGATPSEVEEGITRRVEEAVAGIQGVYRVQSVASEGRGSINVELTDFADEDEVYEDVKSAVDRLVDFPPQRAEEAEVTIAEAVSSVMQLVVSGPVPETELRSAAEFLQDALLDLDGVSLVTLDGARAYEISIEISERTLRQYGLTLEQVANRIRQYSVNLSAGEIKSNAGDLLIRTNKKLMTGAEFESIPIQSLPNGTTLLLRDIAIVRDAFVDDQLRNEFNGKPAIFVQVSRSDSEDVLEIAEIVKSNLDGISIPYDVDIEIFQDQAVVLEQRIDLLVRNGILGFTLVVTFLVLMLDLKLAVWVAMGVPISFLGAMIFFAPLGVEITMVSLFGLIMVLGVVVDDAIVVGENIGAVHETGLRGVGASIAGAKGVFSPVSIGVLTSMAAFAPLLFATGTFGQILGAVPLVVITVLVISMIEVFLILPAHLSHEGYWSRWPLSSVQSLIASGVAGFRDRVLVPAAAWAVKRRYLTLVLAIVFLVFCGSLLGTNSVRFLFFPAIESDTVSASLTYPVGTPYNATEAGAEQLRNAVLRVNEAAGNTEIRSLSMVVGGGLQLAGGPGGPGGVSASSNRAQVILELADESIRQNSSAEIERLWRSEVGTIPGVDSLQFTSSFIGGSTMAYQLSHRDSNVLLRAVDALKARLADVEALVQITDDFDLGKRQFDIELTPAGEAAGLTNLDISRQLRQSYFGEEIQRIQRNRNEVKVMVRFPTDERSSTRDFANSRIRLNDGTEVPLFTVASIEENRSYSSITRIDGRRVVEVSARIDSTLRTPNQVIAEVNESVLPALRTEFPRLLIREAGFAQEQAEDFTQLGLLAASSILLMYILLASQLRNYSMPFTVLSAIPFGAGGAIVGHWFLGFDLSFVSIFGIIALSGIVVNNSLVLTDLFLRLRAAGIEFEEAIVEAVRGRFRAVFLTTATTALGLMPMLFETSMQAQFLIPMAVSLATGTVFAAVTTLFIVPSLIQIRKDVKSLFRMHEDTADLKKAFKPAEEREIAFGVASGDESTGSSVAGALPNELSTGPVTEDRLRT